MSRQEVIRRAVLDRVERAGHHKRVTDSTDARFLPTTAAMPRSWMGGSTLASLLESASSYSFPRLLSGSAESLSEMSSLIPRPRSEQPLTRQTETRSVPYRVGLKTIRARMLMTTKPSMRATRISLWAAAT